MTVQPTPTTKEAVDKTSNGSQPESPVGQRSGKDGARPPLLKKVTTYTGTLTELASVEEEKERVRRASHDDPTIALPPPKPTTGLGATDVVLAVGVVGLSAAALLDFNASGSCNAPPADWYCDHVPPNWVMILLSLWSAALVLVGVGNVRTIVSEYFSTPRATDGVAWRVPLTDASFYDIGTANKFANSCQVREKGLKIVQYVLKGGAYAKVFPKPVGDAMKSLSKTTSIARRFFKFLRWIKHFEDYHAAKEESNRMMRTLLYLRVAANLGADWAEDVCSLERIGFLPKGTLSAEFMLFAEYCQLALALVEIGISAVMVRKQDEVTVHAETSGPASPRKAPKEVLKQRRKLGMMRLELVKFTSDVGKAIYDCELPFAHEGVFICCSLFSAFVSTHKNMVKVLK